MVPRLTRLLILIALVCLASRTAAALDNADCLTCHGDESLVKKDAAGKTISLFVDEARFKASIHAKNLCTSCHTDITDLPHPDNFVAKSVSCAQCHRVETEIYLKSDHGQAVHKGVQEAASCKDCHGSNHYLLNYRNPQSPVYRTNLPQTCGRCHGNAPEMEKFHLRQRSPVVSYEKSVHGIALLQKGEVNAAVCTDCHGSHNLHRSTNPASKLYWQNVPNTCGKCHENVEQTYNLSVHGTAVKAGVRDAPVCTDCHGEHSITAVKLAASRVAPANIPETCGQCHAAQRIITQYRLPPNVFATYAQSFHGLALQGGNLTAANCASCHGIHDILPASDSRSTINAQNLPETCGKCHPGIGTRLSAEFFRIHAPPGAAAGKPWIVNFISWFYIALITMTIGGMASFNLLDYLHKTRAHIRAVRNSEGESRLTRWMRFQHYLLMGLFILLVYTGFAHKFPDAFWSWPFRALPNGSAVRGLIHRVCGWTFAGFFLAHLVALVGTRRGREHFRALWFVRDDLKDAFAQLTHNLGLRPTPPPHRRWNYAEKAEYWALIWGSVVMIVTGVMLVFTATVLATLPKVWHDVAQVIHYYEATLAALAILVWHFYWTIFDPDEYPMNPSWLLGKKAAHPRGAAKPEPPAADSPGPSRRRGDAGGSGRGQRRPRGRVQSVRRRSPAPAGAAGRVPAVPIAVRRGRQADRSFPGGGGSADLLSSAARGHPTHRRRHSLAASRPGRHARGDEGAARAHQRSGRGRLRVAERHAQLPARARIQHVAHADGEVARRTCRDGGATQAGDPHHGTPRPPCPENIQDQHSIGLRTAPGRSARDPEGRPLFRRSLIHEASRRRPGRSRARLN